MVIERRICLPGGTNNEKNQKFGKNWMEILDKKKRKGKGKNEIKMSLKTITQKIVEKI